MFPFFIVFLKTGFVFLVFERREKMKLKVNNVHKFYGTNEAKIEVLKGINCEVLDGEICVLLGPSGSGKSTL